VSDGAHTVSGMDDPPRSPPRRTERRSPIPSPGWLHAVGVFDLETTGVDVRTDRIVTAHVGLLDRDGGVVAARDWLADPGIAIPAAAAAIHGIGTDRARADGLPAAEVVADVVGTLRGLFAAGIPVVAYNASFDFSLLAYEALRHGVEPIAAPWPVIDPLVVDRRYDRYRRGPRTLAAVADHYAVRLDGAHDASADAVAAGRLAQAIARRFAAWLPDSPGELHARQVGWARAQAANLTAYFVSIGRLDPEEAVDGRWPVR
jgi:DNA polymerase III subunit epsilon